MARYPAQNIFAQGQEAFDDAYDRTQGFRETATRRRAGQQLAGGDRKAAAATFAGQGMIGEARQLEADQTAAEDRTARQDQQAFQNKRQVNADQVAQAKRNADVLGQLAQGLKGVPAGQRQAALQHALPIFQQIGVDPAPFAALKEDQLTDEQLDLFSGELAKQVELFNTRRGVVAVDRRALNRNLNDPNAVRTLYEDPYYDELQEATIEQKRAAAAKSRRGPVGRAGGGGAVIPALPSGFVIEK